MDSNSILKSTCLMAVGVACFVWAWSGRYDFELVQLGEMNRNQFLLDKKTGRVWQKVCDGEIKQFECEGTMIWEEMYVDDWTPPDSRAALVYNYLLKKREEEKLEKANSKK